MLRIRPAVTLSYTIKPVIYGELAGWLMRVPKRFVLFTGIGYVFTGERARWLSHLITVDGCARVKLKKFRTVSTFLSNLKTAFSGIYHVFGFVKYAHHYLAEVQYRFNRRFDLKTILARLLRAASLKSPRPERILSYAANQVYFFKYIV